MQTIGLKPWAITADGGFCDYWDYTIKRPNLVKEPPKGRYGTDLLTDEAIQFINKSGDHPFYVYLAYTAPHYPLQAPEEEIAPFKKLGLPEETAIVYGMIARLDKSIGRLLQAVKDRGIEDNTIVVFTSDNGPEFRGEKGGDAPGSMVVWPEKKAMCWRAASKFQPSCPGPPDLVQSPRLTKDW